LTSFIDPYIARHADDRMKWTIRAVEREPLTDRIA
jgi:hypothetical protein